RAALADVKSSGLITSDTGEITLNSKRKTLRIVTPKSELLTGEGVLCGKVLAGADMSCFQTIALLSLDNLPLAESKRMLLVQLTDMSNEDVTFKDKDRKILIDWGHLPQMLQRGSAELSLALPADIQATPLNLDGTPAEKSYPTTFENGLLRLRIATDSLPGGSLSVLLTR
ncbi:MAG: hypothetical protein IJJ26_10625, partial [Victivallales bacterium]|nr:hypothetical protein [Victivallales bacterium]